MQLTRRFLRYSFLVFASFVALLFLLSYIIRKYFEEDVTRVIVNELNKTLAAKVDVKDINFSIISSFPRASLNFRNVVIYSSPEFDQKEFSDSDKVLVSRSVSLRFNLIDLYNRNYDIKSIVLEDTHLWLLQDQKGNNNFKIWKDSNDTSEVSMSVSLEYILADNIFWNYGKKGTEVYGFIDEIDFAGQYIAGDLTAQCFMTGHVQSITDKNFRYVQRIPLIISTNFAKSGTSINLTSTSLKSKDIALEFECEIENGDELRYNLDLKEGKTSVKAVQWFMPDSIQHKIQPYGVYGDIQFSGNISKLSPAVKADLKLFTSDFSILYDGIRIHANGLVDVSLPNLENPNILTATSEALKIKLNDQNWIQSKIDIHKSSKSKLKAQWDSDFHITEVALKPYIDSVFQFTGTISGRTTGTYDFNQKFNCSQLENIAFEAELFNANAGAITAADRNYAPPAINNFNGKFTLAHGKLTASNYVFNINNGTIKGELVATNICEFIHNSGEEIAITVSSEIDSIDYHTIASFIPNDKSSNSTKEKPLNINLQANVTAKTFIFDNHLLENINTATSLHGNTLKIEKASANTPFGNILFSGQYALKEKQLDFQSQLSDVNISKFLYEFDNFSQEYLTDKHLFGMFEGRISGTIPLTDSGSVDRKKLDITSDFVIDNGRLINFAPLLEMSKYLKEDELENIEFDRIENVLSIKNDSLFLPKMKISSSLADFSVSGQQSLDNAFDYRVEILLNKVLSARRNKRAKQEEFGQIQDDGYGRTMLPLRISGNPDNFKVSYDRKAMKQSVVKRWKEQTAELKEILRNEFSGNKTGKKPPEETEPIPTDFEFDWDE